MSEDPILVLLKDEDVVFVDNSTASELSKEGHQTFLVAELKLRIGRKIQAGSSGATNNVGNAWVRDGVSCGAMFSGSDGWKDGKVFVAFVFIREKEPVQGELVGEVIHLPPASTEVMPETSAQPEGE